MKNKFITTYFIVILITSFSPLKVLAYISPFILLIIYILKYPNKFNKFVNTLILISILLPVYLIIYGDKIVIQNYLLAILTYSSFLFILIYNYNIYNFDQVVVKIYPIIKFTLLIQSSIGILQAFYGYSLTGSFGGSNGDFVEGTIHLPLSAELTFSNPLYSINMIYLLIFILFYNIYYRKKDYSVILIGLFSVVLASVVHQIIFLVMAILLSLVVIYNKRITFKLKINALLLSIAFILFSIFFLKGNILQLSNFYSGFLGIEYPRAKITIDSFTNLIDEAPLYPFIGLGAGQFSSRASLIGSGLYLGGIENPRSAPFLDSKPSYFAKNYPIRLLEENIGIKYYGSTHQPFYSFLSIITEFGFILFIIMIYYFIKFIKKIKNYSGRDNKNSIIAFFILLYSFFIFLLGFQENYFEIPQAIFLGLFTIKFFYNRLNEK